MTPEGEEIRTIFVTGFPPDAKEREVQNMLRWWPGYEACQLTFKGDQPLGFAIFSTPAMAFAARDALQGLIFDADHNSVLRVELAKTNLHRRKGLPGGGDGYDHSKRSRVDPMAAYMPGAAAAAMGSFMPAAYDAYASSFTPLPAAPAAAPKTYTPLPAPPSGMPGKIYRDNPPCNTLYLGNLGLQVSEAELLQIFSVTWNQHQQCTHTALQGITLAFPLRLTYSPSPPSVPFPTPLRQDVESASAVHTHGAAGHLSRLLSPSRSSALPISPSSALLPSSPLPSCQDVDAASAVHTALQGISLASSDRGPFDQAVFLDSSLSLSLPRVLSPSLSLVLPRLLFPSLSLVLPLLLPRSLRLLSPSISCPILISVSLFLPHSSPSTFSRTPLGQKGHRAMEREGRDPAAGPPGAAGAGLEPPPAGTAGEQ
ncbi:unnamed protein product [Closterium sp. Naga37s-1]|nr:unnamed protein product [Closterium sp. Naga37s-1]